MSKTKSWFGNLTHFPGVPLNFLERIGMVLLHVSARGYARGPLDLVKTSADDLEREAEAR